MENGNDLEKMIQFLQTEATPGMQKEALKVLTQNFGRSSQFDSAQCLERQAELVEEGFASCSKLTVQLPKPKELGKWFQTLRKLAFLYLEAKHLSVYVEGYLGQELKVKCELDIVIGRIVSTKWTIPASQFVPCLDEVLRELEMTREDITLVAATDDVQAAWAKIPEHSEECDSGVCSTGPAQQELDIAQEE